MPSSFWYSCSLSSTQMRGLDHILTNTETARQDHVADIFDFLCNLFFSSTVKFTILSEAASRLYLILNLADLAKLLYWIVAAENVCWSPKMLLNTYWPTAAIKLSKQGDFLPIVSWTNLLGCLPIMAVFWQTLLQKSHIENVSQVFIQYSLACKCWAGTGYHRASQLDENYTKKDSARF